MQLVACCQVLAKSGDCRKMLVARRGGQAHADTSHLWPLAVASSGAGLAGPVRDIFPRRFDTAHCVAGWRRETVVGVSAKQSDVVDGNGCCNMILRGVLLCACSVGARRVAGFFVSSAGKLEVFCGLAFLEGQCMDCMDCLQCGLATSGISGRANSQPIASGLRVHQMIAPP